MTESARILVVEDEVVAGEDVCGRLTGIGLTVDGPIRSAPEALMRVKSGPPDLVLMDVHLAGGTDGIAAADQIRAEFDIPVVFLTAHSDDATVRRATDAGPFGYLLKPVSEAHLKTTIALALSRHDLERQARHEAERREKALREEAARDELTGVWNRRRILDLLEMESVRATRERHSIAVLMIDVDGFKIINDSHGHLAGDAVLHEIAHRMKRVIRPYDALGRYGGDEFLLVSPDGYRPHVRDIVTRLKVAVAAAPMRFDRTSFDVAISVGFWIGEIGEVHDPRRLVAGADRSLFESKRATVGPGPPGNEATIRLLVERVQSNFREMPGLCLTAREGQRLWGLERTECEAVLEALLKANFLTRTRTGAFVRRQ